VDLLSSLPVASVLPPGGAAFASRSETAGTNSKSSESANVISEGTATLPAF